MANQLLPVTEGGGSKRKSIFSNAPVDPVGKFIASLMGDKTYGENQYRDPEPSGTENFIQDLLEPVLPADYRDVPVPSAPEKPYDPVSGEQLKTVGEMTAFQPRGGPYGQIGPGALKIADLLSESLGGEGFSNLAVPRTVDYSHLWDPERRQQLSEAYQRDEAKYGPRIAGGAAPLPIGGAAKGIAKKVAGKAAQRGSVGMEEALRANAAKQTARQATASKAVSEAAAKKAATEQAAKQAAEKATQATFDDVSKSLIGAPPAPAVPRTRFPGMDWLDDLIKGKPKTGPQVVPANVKPSYGTAAAKAGAGTALAAGAYEALTGDGDRVSDKSLSDLVTEGYEGVPGQEQDVLPDVLTPEALANLAGMNTPAPEAPVETVESGFAQLEQQPDPTAVMLGELIKMTSAMREKRDPKVEVPQRQDITGGRLGKFGNFLRGVGDAGVAFSRGAQGDFDVNRGRREELGLTGAADVINRGRQDLDPVDASLMDLVQNMTQSSHSVRTQGAEQERLMKAGLPLEIQKMLIDSGLDINKMEESARIQKTIEGDKTRQDFEREQLQKRLDMMRDPAIQALIQRRLQEQGAAGPALDMSR